MSGQITLQLSADDLIAAYRAGALPLSRKRLSVLAVVAVLYAILLSWLFGDTAPMHKAIYAGVLLVALVAVVLLARFLSMRFWVPHDAKRIYAQQADLRTPITWRWDDEKLYTTSVNGDTHYPWSDFYQWLRTDKMLLIYRSQQMFHFLPLTSEDRRLAADDIIACLTNAGVGPRK